MICGMKNRASLDCLNKQLLIGLYIFFSLRPFLIWKMFEKMPLLSVQRHGRAKGEIINLRGNEMYNLPIKQSPPSNVSSLQWWRFALRSRYRQLRHGMHFAVMFCSNANSDYTSCIQRLLLEIPHYKIHILVSKTITLKLTENTCCVDIVWRGKK